MQLSFEYDRTYFPAFPVLEMMLIDPQSDRRQPVSGLIDTGSDGTQVPERLLRTLGARVIDERAVQDLSGLRYPVSIYAVHLQIGTAVLQGVEVIGRRGITEIVVGRDVLNQFVLTLNGLAHTTEIRD